MESECSYLLTNLLISLMKLNLNIKTINKLENTNVYITPMNPKILIEIAHAINPIIPSKRYIFDIILA